MFVRRLQIVIIITQNLQFVIYQSVDLLATGKEK